MQLYSAMPSLHSPWTQGSTAHSSILISQLSPGQDIETFHEDKSTKLVKEWNETLQSKVFVNNVEHLTETLPESGILLEKASTSSDF